MTDQRYSRQTLFTGIGEEGQQRIGAAHLAIIGCGALGTVASEMLVRAGVGQVTIIDRDFVELSNLQRQTLFSEADAAANLPKAVAAADRLRQVNSDVSIVAQVADLTADNAAQLLGGAEIFLDATDNFETRYLLNDFAFQQSIPWIYAGCVGSYGVAFALQPGRTGCLQCLFPEMPAPGTLDTCDTAGVLAPVVQAVVAFQVSQAFKLMVGAQTEPCLFQVDVWQDQWRTLPMNSRPETECRCCGKREFGFLAASRQDRMVRLCGRNAVQISPASKALINFPRLEARLKRSGRVVYNEYLMRIDVDDFEISLFKDGRSIIRGTDDLAVARSVYSRYIGR